MTSPRPSVLFIGESPPPGAPPDFRPFDCASGTRLAKHLLGLVDRATLLEHVPRANVFDTPTGPPGCPPWDPEAARVAAERHVLAAGATPPAPYRARVLLGAKVADAFGKGHLPPLGGACASHDPPGAPTYYLRVPHPSGTSTALKSPDAIRAARLALLPELVLGCPTLRPWHFRLDDPTVLADLAVAVGPHDPAAAAAALLHAAAQHRLAAAVKSAPLLAAARLHHAAASELPTDPWDCPLLDVARTLLVPDGGRVLAAAWHPRGQRNWLAKAPTEFRTPITNWLPELAGALACRTVAIRYALAGVA